MGPPIIELVDATIVRGGRPVIDGLTLTIREGEHTAILGPNGAGKSSLLRLLTLDDRPLAAADGSPSLRLFGRDRWDLTHLRRQLAVVTGELDAGFGIGTSGGRVRAGDVALSGLLGSHGVFSHHDVTPQMRIRARRALKRIAALHLAERPLNELSAGERRRVVIARALVTNPRALVLDEPTAGLDIVARHAFLETVRRLAAGGTTIIVVTHHVEEIVPETRRVVLLRDGKVEADGPPARVLTAANLSRVFGGPVQVARAGGYYAVRHGSRLRDRMAKYGKSAQKNVESAMHRRKRGTLKSGSGRTVKSRKQAIAIGLSEAREKGGKVPPKRKGTKKKAARKK